MKKIIIANFKMNQTAQETKEYLMKFLCKLENSSISLVFCPPFTSLSVSNFFLSGGDVMLGAQNVSDDENGFNTGEISARMLKASGVSYVLVGHPERKSKFKESNSFINKKIKAALKEGLKCVLFVGESLAEKNTLKTAEVLKKQIEECLKGLYENELESIIICYEPLWALSKEACGIKDIEAGAKIIRKVVKENYSEKAGRDLALIYGGGINPLNAAKILQAKEIDGAVIGLSSLDPNSFVELLNKIK